MEVFIDLRKAFHLIDYDILLKKLQMYQTADMIIILFGCDKSMYSGICSFSSRVSD